MSFQVLDTFQLRFPQVHGNKVLASLIFTLFWGAQARRNHEPSEPRVSKTKSRCSSNTSPFSWVWNLVIALHLLERFFLWGGSTNCAPFFLIWFCRTHSGSTASGCKAFEDIFGCVTCPWIRCMFSPGLSPSRRSSKYVCVSSGQSSLQPCMLLAGAMRFLGTLITHLLLLGVMYNYIAVEERSWILDLSCWLKQEASWSLQIRLYQVVYFFVVPVFWPHPVNERLYKLSVFAATFGSPLNIADLKCWNFRLQQAAFSLLNLTWIWGAFFGAIVGFGRSYMPEDAVFNMNVWVKELHGPNGSAPCGPWVLGLVSWLRETYQHVFVAVCWSDPENLKLLVAPTTSSSLFCPCHHQSSSDLRSFCPCLQLLEVLQ